MSIVVILRKSPSYHPFRAKNLPGGRPILRSEREHRQRSQCEQSLHVVELNIDIAEREKVIPSKPLSAKHVQ